MTTLELSVSDITIWSVTLRAPLTTQAKAKATAMVLIVQASLRIITNDHHNNMFIVQAIGPQASNKLKMLWLIHKLRYNF
jgi:hypothetical protein